MNNQLDYTLCTLKDLRQDASIPMRVSHAAMIVESHLLEKMEEKQ